MSDDQRVLDAGVEAFYVSHINRVYRTEKARQAHLTGSALRDGMESWRPSVEPAIRAALRALIPEGAVLVTEDGLAAKVAALMHQRDGHKRPLGYRGKGETLRGDDLCDYFARKIVDEWMRDLRDTPS
jgi:hypothetical protein